MYCITCIFIFVNSEYHTQWSYLQHHTYVTFLIINLPSYDLNQDRLESSDPGRQPETYIYYISIKMHSIVWWHAFISNQSMTYLSVASSNQRLYLSSDFEEANISVYIIVLYLLSALGWDGSTIIVTRQYFIKSVLHI